jgi:ketosteroid isomerase-like protein
MSEQHNLEIVRRGYEAFGHGDLDTLLGLFDDQIEWVTPGPADLPSSGRRTGKQEVAQFFGIINDLFDIHRFEPREMIAQGDRVIVLGEESAAVRATGKVLDNSWVHAFTLRNGRVVAFQEYLDTAATVAELRAAKASVAAKKS